MNLKTLLNLLKNGVHDDGDTQAWSSVNYGRRHKVYIGPDRRMPPGEDDCPLVSIFPAGKHAGMELEVMNHIMGVTCVLFDADTKVLARDFLVEKEIVGNLIDFATYVEKAINALSLTGLWVNEVISEYDFVESFPYMVAGMEIHFGHDYSQGETDYFD